MIIARTSSDAPDIDGLVYIEMTDEHPVNVGDITQVTITDTDEYDMWAKFSD
jgi:ribosomal protein S12 methylthiotransferase